MKSIRIGVFGGTFDPVHNGHLQLAHLAIKEVGLEQLLFIPAAQPPHKNRVLTPIKHRVAMLEIVCRDSDNLVCSSIESSLPKPSYTVDTLSELQKRFPESTDFFFIIGSDAFVDLMTWKAYLTLLSMVQIVVSPRAGYSDHFLHSFLNTIGYTHTDNRWSAEYPKKDITLLSRPPQGVSSSDVRKILANNGDTTTMLHPDVSLYIQKNNLYNP